MCLSVQLALDAFLKVFVWLILLFRVLLFTTDVHFFFCCVGESNYNFLVSEYYLCDVLNNVLIFNFVIRFLNLVLHLSFTPKHSKICLLWLLLEVLFAKVSPSYIFSCISFAKVSHYVFFLWEVKLPFFNSKWKFWNEFSCLFNSRTNDKINGRPFCKYVVRESK